MNRVAAVLTGALLLVGLSAAPALAHTRASSATNFDSEIVSAPDVAGVTWRVYPGGEYLEVVNASPTPVTVLGYEGEPYLRVGPQGVERNRNSPATYLNLDRYADVAVPPRASAEAAPDWEHVSTEPRHAWHDHRTHWMAPEPPTAVATGRGTEVLVQHWNVPFEHDGELREVAGVLRWVPGPRWWPWLAVALLLTLPALMGRRAAAAVVAGVALLNLAHLPDEVAALPVPALDVVFGLLHNLLFIGAALVGAALTWRARTTSLLPLGIGSGAVLFHQGLLQVSQLGASQLATVWPTAIVRMLVALSIAQALWVGIVIARSVRAGVPSAAALGTFLPPDPSLSAPRNDEQFA